MDLSGFFDYPEAQSLSGQDELLLLASWDQDSWARLFAVTTIRRLAPAEVLIRPGEVDRGLYLVASGALEVLIPQAGSEKLRRIALIEPGSVIGEQSFLDGKPRSALVQALHECEVVRLSFEAFEIFAARDPELARALLFDLGRILSLRLRQTTAVVARWMS